MTPEQIAAKRALHSFMHGSARDFCACCDEDWPCDAVQALEALTAVLALCDGAVGVGFETLPQEQVRAAATKPFPVDPTE